MKPTKEIIGLRIISISDGTQVGVVKDFILNPQRKTLDFLIVDHPTDYFGAKVIPFTDILGLGEFAVMIPHLNVIQDVAQNQEAQNLLKQDTRVLGTKVLTRKGQLVGEVKEILIDEETGRIAACLYESDARMQEVSAEQIITLGKELLIIEEEQKDQKVQNHEISADNSEELSQTSPYISFETPTDVNFQEFNEEASFNEVIGFNEDVGLNEEAGFKDEVGFNEEASFTEEVDPIVEPEVGFNLFEQRQLQYFIGKKVDKNIILDNGDTLRAGEIITPEIVTYVTTRSTLMEVTSHLQKN